MVFLFIPLWTSFQSTEQDMILGYDFRTRYDIKTGYDISEYFMNALP